jgi:predicted kinase
MKDLILVRGVSGAGKTTVAHMFSGAIVLSADDHFVDEGGRYHFVPSKLMEAHAVCQSHTKDHMQEEAPLIVVANTFTREWELKPYIEMANYHGYRVFSIIVEKRHSNPNVHGVSEAKVNMMRERFEIQL